MKTLKVDIRKKCGSFQLVSKFETSADRFALLGASGSGKSMTLKCIAGIEKPDEGFIAIGDRVLFDSKRHINVPVRKRRVGYLFQNYALFPNMTAFANINMICRDPSRTESLLNKFDIHNCRDLRPSKMSGGQCQRLALARVIASDPEVILLDEPFSALDNYMHTIIEREIMDLLSGFDGPSVLVSHDRNEVFRMCDTIGVMDNGSLIDIQDKEGFFDHPATLVAARLTGCKNITRLTEDGFATDWGIKLGLPPSDLKEGYKYAGYRAHFFEVAGEEQKGRENVFEVQVERVIEDTFSNAICFRQKGNDVKSPDSLLTYITGKDTDADDVKFLKFDPSRLMLLRR